VALDFAIDCGVGDIPRRVKTFSFSDLIWSSDIFGDMYSLEGVDSLFEGLCGGWPKVLLAAKTYGSVFYDKLSPSIARGKW